MLHFFIILTFIYVLLKMSIKKKDNSIKLLIISFIILNIYLNFNNLNFNNFEPLVVGAALRNDLERGGYGAGPPVDRAPSRPPVAPRPRFEREGDDAVAAPSGAAPPVAAAGTGEGDGDSFSGDPAFDTSEDEDKAKLIAAPRPPDSVNPASSKKDTLIKSSERLKLNPVKLMSFLKKIPSGVNLKKIIARIKPENKSSDETEKEEDKLKKLEESLEAEKIRLKTTLTPYAVNTNQIQDKISKQQELIRKQRGIIEARLKLEAAEREETMLLENRSTTTNERQVAGKATQTATRKLKILKEAAAAGEAEITRLERGAPEPAPRLAARPSAAAIAAAMNDSKRLKAERQRLAERQQTNSNRPPGVNAPRTGQQPPTGGDIGKGSGRSRFKAMFSRGKRRRRGGTNP